MRRLRYFVDGVVGQECAALPKRRLIEQTKGWPVGRRTANQAGAGCPRTVDRVILAVPRAVTDPWAACAYKDQAGSHFAEQPRPRPCAKTRIPHL